jgi:excisionase family DNA binding protein
MKSTLEQEDIQGIVQAVIEGLRPLLSGKSESRVDDMVLDVPGLCEYLHVTPRWIHQRTHLKEIPFHKLSNKELRFKKKDINKWLDTLGTPAISEYRGNLKVIR